MDEWAGDAYLGKDEEMCDQKPYWEPDETTLQGEQWNGPMPVVQDTMLREQLNRIVIPRRILVTGGTGTFGHAFAARVLDGSLYDQVVIFSRDELKQLQMREEFGNDPRLRFFLGDVRDSDRLERAMRGAQVVVHAAALKQVDRSAEAFDEFLKTNTVGALNVVGACHRAGVRQCVALSTDKAVGATTPYGVSKAAAEWVFVGGNAWGDCKFSLVRYGNILGSRGSVLQLWEKQARDPSQPATITGYGKLTITDPEMTRFWMPIEDAVDLVLLALDRMRGGEIFVPKGAAHSTIADLAMKHFPMCGHEVMGKRSYEKRHERLVAPEEVDRLRDAGDVYVLLPHSWNWAPDPYGADSPLVPEGFEYTSRKGDVARSPMEVALRKIVDILEEGEIRTCEMEDGRIKYDPINHRISYCIGVAKHALGEE